MFLEISSFISLSGSAATLIIESARNAFNKNNYQILFNFATCDISRAFRNQLMERNYGSNPFFLSIHRFFRMANFSSFIIFK